MTVVPQVARMVYARRDRCPCGAGLAYVKGGDPVWDCSALLLGTAIPRGQAGAATHTAKLPRALWEIEPEQLELASTRPT